MLKQQKYKLPHDVWNKNDVQLNKIHLGKTEFSDQGQHIGHSRHATPVVDIWVNKHEPINETDANVRTADVTSCHLPFVASGMMRRLIL